MDGFFNPIDPNHRQDEQPDRHSPKQSALCCRSPRCAMATGIGLDQTKRPGRGPIISQSDRSTQQSSGLQLGQLITKPLGEAGLHQGAEIIHEIALHLPDRTGPVTGAAQQASPLQLAKLAADV